MCKDKGEVLNRMSFVLVASLPAKTQLLKVGTM